MKCLIEDNRIFTLVLVIVGLLCMFGSVIVPLLFTGLVYYRYTKKELEERSEEYGIEVEVVKIMIKSCETCGQVGCTMSCNYWVPKKKSFVKYKYNGVMCKKCKKFKARVNGMCRNCDTMERIRKKKEKLIPCRVEE